MWRAEALRSLLYNQMLTVMANTRLSPQRLSVKRLSLLNSEAETAKLRRSERRDGAPRR